MALRDGCSLTLPPSCLLTVPYWQMAHLCTFLSHEVFRKSGPDCQGFWIGFAVCIGRFPPMSRLWTLVVEDLYKKDTSVCGFYYFVYWLTHNQTLENNFEYLPILLDSVDGVGLEALTTSLVL